MDRADAGPHRPSRSIPVLEEGGEEQAATAALEQQLAGHTDA
jgi:hypothetical protein